MDTVYFPPLSFGLVHVTCFSQWQVLWLEAWNMTGMPPWASDITVWSSMGQLLPLSLSPRMNTCEGDPTPSCSLSPGKQPNTNWPAVSWVRKINIHCLLSYWDFWGYLTYSIVEETAPSCGNRKTHLAGGLVEMKEREALGWLFLAWAKIVSFIGVWKSGLGEERFGGKWRVSVWIASGLLDFWVWAQGWISKFVHH